MQNEKSVCVVLIVYAITTIWEGRGVYRFSTERMAMHSFKFVLQLLHMKGYSCESFYQCLSLALGFTVRVTLLEVGGSSQLCVKCNLGASMS